MASRDFKDMVVSAQMSSRAQIKSSNDACDEADEHVRTSRKAIARSLELLGTKYFKGFA